MSAALAHFGQTPPQGECTLVLGGAAPQQITSWSEAELRAELEALLAQGLSRREAARTLAERSGHNKRELYALLHNRLSDGPVGGTAPQ